MDLLKYSCVLMILPFQPSESSIVRYIALQNVLFIQHYFSIFIFFVVTYRMNSKIVTNPIAASITTSLLISVPLTTVGPSWLLSEDCLIGLRFTYRIRYSMKRMEKAMMTAGWLVV